MRCRFFALPWMLLVWVSIARAERLPVKTYGLADGLPSTFVDHMVSDSRGLLWFSTRDGLARFDGSRFVSYGIEDGLSVPQVSFLLESRRGVYWVATNGGGVCRMDAAAVTLAAATDHTEAPTKIRTPFECVSLGDARADHVNVLHEDPFGRIWVGTDGGLFRFDIGTGGQRRPLRIEISEAWADRRRVGVSAMISGEAGEMWVGTGRGLVRLLADDRAVQYPVPAAAAGSPVRDIARGVHGQIWIAYPRGLLRVCGKHQVCSPIEHGGPARHETSQWLGLREAEIGESALVVSAARPTEPTDLGARLPRSPK